MRRNPALDALRGLAVLGVLAHDTPWLRNLPGAGPVVDRLAAGWDVGFVLAGYLLTAQGLDVPEGSPGPLARRALRILPLYYTTLAIAVVVALGDRGPIPWDALPGSLTFTQLVPLYWGGEAPQLAPFEHAWAVAVVVQFTLIWPAILGQLGRRGVALAATTLVLVGLGLRGAGLPPVLLLSRADGLALGAWLAASGPSGPLARRSALLAIVGLVGIALGAAGGIAAPTAAALLGVGLVGLATRAEDPPPAAARPLRNLGRISYGLYIYHFLYVYILSRAVPPGRQTARQSALVFAATLLTAAVSWAALEAPFLELGARRREGAEGAAGEVAGQKNRP